MDHGGSPPTINILPPQQQAQAPRALPSRAHRPWLVSLLHFTNCQKTELLSDIPVCGAVFLANLPLQICINTVLLSQLSSFYPLIFFFRIETSFSPLHVSLNEKNDKELLTWDHFHRQRKNILFSYLSAAASDYHLSEQSCPKGQLGWEPTLKWKLIRQLIRNSIFVKLKALVSKQFNLY